MTDETLRIPCQVTDHSLLPEYAHPHDAGADLKASIPMSISLWPGQRKAIPTGLSVAIPEGYELQIRSRSGLSLNHGIVVANSPGTIDPGYRGEIKVILQNTDDHKPFTIEPGARIAQAVLVPVLQAIFEPVNSLERSVRGENGFGSSGI
jgi:dUTP pyrophosphatase